MQAGLLHVVVPYSNPVRWKSRKRLYEAFEQHMLDEGVRVTTVECAFGDIPHELTPDPSVNHVKVWAKSQIWAKENLINLGIQSLPRDWKYVAWIDADIAFRKAGWAAETVYALQHFDVIQPWEICYDLGPNDEHLGLHHSFGRQWIKDPITCHKLGKGYTFAHCLPGDSRVVPGGRVSAASSRPFDGNLVVVSTASGNELSCTFGHPILTGRGWVPASDVRVGDNVFSHVSGDGIPVNTNKEDVPSRIEDVARTFSEKIGVNRTAWPTSPQDFHGDAPNGQVAVVWSDGFLSCETAPSFLEKPLKNEFWPASMQGLSLNGESASTLLFEGFNASASSVQRVAASRDRRPLFSRGLAKHPTGDFPSMNGPHLRSECRPSDLMSFGSASGDTALLEQDRGVSRIHADDISSLFAGLAGQIQADKVINVSIREFSGHVFNLETEHGYIISNGVVTHNCGYAWASTRSAIEDVGGLLEHAILGAADHHMALALVGNAHLSVPGNIHPSYMKPILRWQERAQRHIAGNLGYLPFNIEHAFHGDKAKRGYIDRWQILTRHQFNQDEDLKYNSSGVIELAGNKPELARDIWRYFRLRDEDANCL